MSHKYLIRPNIRFNTDVTAARFNEETNKWVLSLSHCSNGFTEELGKDLGEWECDIVFNFRKGWFSLYYAQSLETWTDLLLSDFQALSIPPSPKSLARVKWFSKDVNGTQCW